MFVQGSCSCITRCLTIHNRTCSIPRGPCSPSTIRRCIVECPGCVVVLHVASQFKTVLAVFPVGPALPPLSKDVSWSALQAQSHEGFEQDWSSSCLWPQPIGQGVLDWGHQHHILASVLLSSSLSGITKGLGKQLLFSLFKAEFSPMTHTTSLYECENYSHRATWSLRITCMCIQSSWIDQLTINQEMIHITFFFLIGNWSID
jgi:hypothetical protein